jgi:hypothetical protein
MSESVDFESDQLLELLSEALRAGPGSDAWRQAVELLRAQPGPQADEYLLICTARQHLESGKSYRSVRAGPGFTRKVLARIEHEPVRRPRRLSTPGLIALISGVVLAVLLVLLGWLLTRPAPVEEGVEHLGGLYFVRTIASTSFEREADDNWTNIGSLPLVSSRGLRLAEDEPPSAGIAAGGVYWTEPLPPQQPFALDVTIRGGNRPAGNLTVQVFVTDEPQFSAERATTPHELVWLIRDGHAAVVLPDGQVPAQGQRIVQSREPFNVRIMMDRTTAIIDSAGARLWAGDHQLAPDRPRYVGVRLLKEGPEPSPQVIVQSIRVQKP